MSKYEQGQTVWVRGVIIGERTAGGGYYLHVIDEGYAQTISANGRHIKPDVTFPWSPAKNAPLYNPKDVAFKSPAKKAKKQRSKK